MNKNGTQNVVVDVLNKGECLLATLKSEIIAFNCSRDAYEGNEEFSSFGLNVLMEAMWWLLYMWYVFAEKEPTLCSQLFFKGQVDFGGL